MWFSSDMFRDMLKDDFVTLVSLKVPSGTPGMKTRFSAETILSSSSPLFLHSTVVRWWKILWQESLNWPLST